MDRRTGASDSVVVPDRGGQGEEPLSDAGADAGRGAGGVAFEVELVLESVEDRLDDLAQWLEELPARAGCLVVLPRGPDQIDPDVGEVGLEHRAVVALVRHQRLTLQGRPDPGREVGG